MMQNSHGSFTSILQMEDIITELDTMVDEIMEERIKWTSENGAGVIVICCSDSDKFNQDC